MPKNTKNLKSISKDAKRKVPEDEIITEEEDSVVVTPAAELDPEVLSVLENKKKKKVPAPSDVDYIPELERDVDFSDTF